MRQEHCSKTFGELLGSENQSVLRFETCFLLSLNYACDSGNRNGNRAAVLAQRRRIGAQVSLSIYQSARRSYRRIGYLVPTGGFVHLVGADFAHCNLDLIGFVRRAQGTHSFQSGCTHRHHTRN